jgi:2-polyprenyl-6-methoxyphenol hydroxylase-like FAD-dependent oxidoreductase
MVDERTIHFVDAAGKHVAKQYDLMIGADGHQSKVRLALVNRDKKMSSSVSYVGPMRYVSAGHLSPDAPWPSASCAVLAGAPRSDLLRPPQITTSGAIP